MATLYNQPCLSKDGIEKGLKAILGEAFDDRIVKLIKENFIGWFSRSVAASMFLFARNEKGQWCVLANKRGPGCPDFVGCWCVSCGYLNWDENTRQNAIRELLEETGVHIEPDSISLFDYEDSPDANRQNVTFHYYKKFGKKFPKWIPDWLQKHLDPDAPRTTDFKLSRNLCEEDEVDEIKWIPLKEIDDYRWAFGHNNLILKIFNSLKK